jgi:nucleoside-diphosphate-sugar epimerase
MKILVTGGGGFLGQYIIRELVAKGHQPVAFQRRAMPSLSAMGVEVRQGSILQIDSLRKAMNGCDAVIHTAAKAGVWGSRDEYFLPNVEGTKSVLEAMRQCGIEKLVYTSSPSVVFNGSSFDGDDESLPYGDNWLNHYPESKAVAEQAVLEWGREGHGKVIALRPHLIWGQGDPHLLPQVIQRSKAGRLRIIGDGTNRVDTTRVENAAMAHVLAVYALDKASAINRPYFIGQSEPVVLWDWINQFLSALNIPPLEKHFSLKAAYAIGILSEWLWKALGRHTIPPMTRFIAVEMAKSHCYSIAAARHELGYKPEAYPTEEGVQAYIEAWKAGNTPRY